MTVSAAIREGHYRNAVPYKLAPEPIDEDSMTVREAREHAEDQRRRQQDQRKRYAAEQRRLDALFKADLEAAHGISGHPRADKLFELAWGMGHAYGLEEVANHYADLVELIK